MGFENSLTRNAIKIIDVGGTHQTRYDYVSRTDGQPVYIGKAERGQLTSQSCWEISKMSYDESNNIVSTQTASGSWDDRASLTYG